MKLKNISFLLISLLLLANVSCHREEVITPSEEETLTSGVYGTVTKRVGNWMPGANDPLATEYPIVCEIAVFDSINTHDLGGYPYYDRVTISDFNFHEVARTTSGGGGHYQVLVPAGKYSIAAVKGDTIIKNSLCFCDGSGWLEPVEVVEGEMVQHNVLLDYAAY